MSFDLSKREFRDALRLRYDWPIPDSPCVCGCSGCNEIRDLVAELLDMVCYDVAIEPTLQPLAGEELNRGANTAPDARLDVHCRGFWDRQRAAFLILIYGYVTRMRTRTKSLAPNTYINCMKTKRSGSMLLE